MCFQKIPIPNNFYRQTLSIFLQSQKRAFGCQCCGFSFLFLQIQNQNSKSIAIIPSAQSLLLNAILNKKELGFLKKKWLIPRLGKGKYKTALGHLVMSENKEVLKERWKHIQIHVEEGKTLSYSEEPTNPCKRMKAFENHHLTTLRIISEHENLWVQV